MAELQIENLLKQFKLKGATYENDQQYLLHQDKNETEPVWLSPVFAIFQAPHVRLYA